MKRSPHHPTSISFLVLTARILAAGLALLAVPVLLAEDPPAAPTEPQAGVPSGGSRGGNTVRAFIDPATGELTSTPSPAQVEALNQSLEKTLTRSTEGLVPFALNRGGRGVYLQKRFRSALVVRKNAQGNLDFSCVDDHEHLPATLESQEAATADTTVSPLLTPPEGTVERETTPPAER